MDVIYNRDTVYMDLSSPGIIWDNMHSKCRNRVRKAQKSGVVIEIDNSLESLGKFMELYYTTMKRNGADLYYYFSNNYFNNLFELLKDNAYIFNALYDGRVIASSVILKYGDYLNYHLSGTDYRYIRFAPVNLLLYEAALWGSRQGCKYFHLGGGYRENDDSLFEFKKKFSKDGISKFFIGRKIHDEEHYKILVDKWERLNGERKTERLDFFPLYRR
jgi:lipid II:glycine glycyltransferase (peptidoglycan interpeptide bridge formation enzyme)